MSSFRSGTSLSATGEADRDRAAEAAVSDGGRTRRAAADAIVLAAGESECGGDRDLDRLFLLLTPSSGAVYGFT